MAQPLRLPRRAWLQQAGGLFTLGIATSRDLLAQTPKSPPTPNPPLPFAPVTLPPWLANTERQQSDIPNQLPPAQRIRYAVVGLGRIALTEVLPAITQSRYSRLTALVSGTPDKLTKVAAEYGIPSTSLYSYDTFNNIANDTNIDVVYIALPNSLHAPYTVRAAQAGKHVLCEKPMSATVQEADQMIAACRTAGKQLMIAYRIQYEPYNRTMQNLVRSNNLGAVQAYQAHFTQTMGDPTQWRLQKALAAARCTTSASTA